MRCNTDKKSLNTAIIFAVIFAASIVHICVADLSSLDELWNYNFSRMITMGMLPYRDYNMVPTPLFTMLMSLPLFICRNLLVFRIACAFLSAVTACLFFRILANKSDEQLFALPFVLIAVLLTDYVSYNNLFFLIVLIVFFLFERSGFSKYAFAAGALCSASVFARQTSGCLLLITAFILILVFYGKKLRNALLFIAGAVIPGLVFLFYFISTSSLNGFWDYCLFSLTGFGKNNNHIFPGAIVLLILVLAELAVGIYAAVRKKEKIYIIHILLGLPILSVMAPIVDYSHVQFAVIYFFIPVYRIFVSSFAKNIRKNIMVILSALVFMCICGFGFSKVIGTTTSSEIAELKYVPAGQALLSDYSDIADMTSKWKSGGHKVTLFTSSSVIVSIINGEANPPYDTFNEGNFPGSVESHMVYVKEACSGKDNIIIIASDYNEEGWQNPDGVLEYVQENCILTGSYGRFLIFKTA